MRKRAARRGFSSIRSNQSNAVEPLERRALLASVVVTANVADNVINADGTSPYVGGTTLRVGDNGTNVTEGNGIFPFQLPSLPAGATITGASASFNLESIGNASSVVGDMDVYGLGRRSTATVLAGDYYRGAYDGDTTDATAIQPSLATKTTPAGVLTLNASGQANLQGYLQSQYAGGAGAGQYVFLRLGHQAEQLTSRYWVVSTANNATVASRPTITISYEVTPAAPSGLAARTTGASSVRLTWQDNSSNETGFLVERSLDGTTWTTAGLAGTDATSFDDTAGLSADAAYQYRVSATNASASSAPTAAVAGSTLPNFAHTLWVDSGYTGATANGAYATPYKTIASAITAAVAGDGIVLRGGTYRETVTMKAGTTLMGSPNERAIVSGFAAITGWTAGAGGVYQTTLNWKPTTLYVDAKPQPVSSTSTWWTAPTVTADATAGTMTISDPAHLAGIPSLVGGSVQAHVAASNTWPAATITAHDTVNGTVTVATIGGLVGGDYYMVKNHASLIDKPGEWAVASAGGGNYTVTYKPAAAADLNATQSRKLGSAQIRVTNTGNNSVIRGLEVTGNTGFGINIGASTASRAQNVLVRDVIVHNNGGVGVQSRYAANTTLQNSVVVANHTGVSFVSTQVGLIRNNDVGYNEEDGVIVAGDISGKVPGDVGFDPSDSITVDGNYIHDMLGFYHADGIQMYRWPANTVIKNNFITRASQGIMTEQVDSATLTNNVVWNTAAYNVILGHGNSNNWTVQNNTIGGAGYGPYSLTGTGYAMYNNVYYNRVAVNSASAYTGDYNVYFSPDGGAALRTSTPGKNYTSIATFFADTGDDQHSVIGNPLFNGAHAIATVINDNVLTATTTSVVVRATTNFAVGDKIQINGDGVVRTLTGVNATTKTITWDVPLPMVPLSPYVIVENFKASTNFALDLGFKTGSPALGMGRRVGSSVSTAGYAAGDLNGDGVRDVPVVAADIAAGLPPQNGWLSPVF
jgi:hypothetical protein